jgi:hypothetical protein
MLVGVKVRVGEKAYYIICRGISIQLRDCEGGQERSPVQRQCLRTLGEKNLHIMTFMPVSCDQICVKTPMWRRLIIRGRKSSMNETSAFCRSNSIICLISSISSFAMGLFGSPFPWTRVSTACVSSHRSLRASHRGDSGRKIKPIARIMAGTIWRAQGTRKAFAPSMKTQP